MSSNPSDAVPGTDALKMPDLPSNEYDRRSVLLNWIYPYYDFLPHEVFTYQFKTGQMGLIEAAAPMLKKAFGLLATKADAGFGYSIEHRNAFIYGSEKWGQAYEGLYLALVGPEGGQAGVVEFKIGVPFQITCIQGQNSKYSKKADALEISRATGKPFYEILLKRMFHCVGASVRFHEDSEYRPLPKVEFDLAFNQPSGKILRNISDYVHKGERTAFIGHPSALSRIRPKFFSKPWRIENGKINLPPAKKAIML